ncbi:MAG: diguanylate cyclase [Chloroflexi bacterium]|nr:diguanylate cyclase [Chloroflexota bacterium]
MRGRAAGFATALLGGLVCGGGPKFTISVGVACYPKDGATMAALGRHADQAMYAAKAAGGDASRAWSHRATGQAA